MLGKFSAIQLLWKPYFVVLKYNNVLKYTLSEGHKDGDSAFKDLQLKGTDTVYPFGLLKW